MCLFLVVSCWTNKTKQSITKHIFISLKILFFYLMFMLFTLFWHGIVVYLIAIFKVCVMLSHQHSKPLQNTFVLLLKYCRTLRNSHDRCLIDLGNYSITVCSFPCGWVRPWSGRRACPRVGRPQCSCRQLSAWRGTCWSPRWSNACSASPLRFWKSTNKTIFMFRNHTNQTDPRIGSVQRYWHNITATTGND